MNLLDVALAHAARGWPVFPLEPGGKRPLGRLAPHGLKDATLDLDRIRWLWSQEQPNQEQPNVGILTGDRFDVVDIDGPDALAVPRRGHATRRRPGRRPGALGADDPNSPRMARLRRADRAGEHGERRETPRG